METLNIQDLKSGDISSINEININTIKVPAFVSHSQFHISLETNNKNYRLSMWLTIKKPLTIS